MIRHIAVVLGAFILSVLLTAFTGWMIARSADMRLMIQTSADYPAGRSVEHERADALWSALARSYFRGTWIYCPVIALLVGVFSGFFARRHAWQLALIGVAPFSVLFSIGVHRGLLPGVGILAIYLAIAALAASAVARFRRRPREGGATPASRPTTE